MFNTWTGSGVRAEEELVNGVKLQLTLLDLSSRWSGWVTGSRDCRLQGSVRPIGGLPDRSRGGGQEVQPRGRESPHQGWICAVEPTQSRAGMNLEPSDILDIFIGDTGYYHTYRFNAFVTSQKRSAKPRLEVRKTFYLL